MSRTTCCGYTTRSYSLDGQTKWIRNYFAGSKGTPGSGLRVTVDSEGNVYTSGPCAESIEDDGTTWSLISYTPDGEERWKLDLLPEMAARYPSSSRALHLSQCESYDVICTEDDRIVLLLENGEVHSYHPDGTESIEPLIFESGPAPALGMITAENVVNAGFAPGLFAPTGPRCLWGPNHYLVDTGSSNHWNQTNRGGATTPPYLIGPTVVSAPFGLGYTPLKFKHWGFQWQTNSYDYEFWGVALTPKRDASISALAASADRSKIYCGGYSQGGDSGQALHAIKDGIGVQFRRGQLTPEGAHALSGGVGLPPRQIPTVFNTPNVPIADVENTIIWGQMTEAGAHALALPEGVAFSGAGTLSPRLEYHAADTGERIWGHNHQPISGMALARDNSRLITIGEYHNGRNDVSYV